MDFTTPWGPLNPRSPHPDLAAFRHTRFHTYLYHVYIRVFFAFLYLRSNSTTKFSLSLSLCFSVSMQISIYTVHRVDKMVHKAVIP